MEAWGEEWRNVTQFPDDGLSPTRRFGGAFHQRWLQARLAEASTTSLRPPYKSRLGTGMKYPGGCEFMDIRPLSCAILWILWNELDNYITISLIISSWLRLRLGILTITWWHCQLAAWIWLDFELSLAILTLAYMTFRLPSTSLTLSKRADLLAWLTRTSTPSPSRFQRHVVAFDQQRTLMSANR